MAFYIPQIRFELRRSGPDAWPGINTGNCHSYGPAWTTPPSAQEMKDHLAEYCSAEHITVPEMKWDPSILAFRLINPATGNYVGTLTVNQDRETGPSAGGRPHIPAGKLE